MHKSTIDTTMTDLEQLMVKAKARLQEAQDHDATVARAEINDIDEKINALEAKRDSMLKLLDHVHAEQKTAIHDTFNAMLKDAADRKEALTGRLAGITGEDKKTNSRRKPKPTPVPVESVLAETVTAAQE